MIAERYVDVEAKAIFMEFKTDVSRKITTKFVAATNTARKKAMEQMHVEKENETSKNLMIRKVQIKITLLFQRTYSIREVY